VIDRDNPGRTIRPSTGGRGGSSIAEGRAPEIPVKARATRPAPAWVRGLARVVPRLPFGRYWLVNLLRRVPAPPFLMRLPPQLGGFAFHCDQRDSVAREVCFTGCYEPQETQLASRLLHAGDVFVDVGANWGYYTLAAAHWVGAAGRVFAFEPEPRLFALLTANLAVNRLDSVRAYQAAVAAGCGRLAFTAFHTDGGNWGQSRSAGRAGQVDFECETVALDDTLDAAGIGPVQLTKIDVEGGEVEVLAGMRRGLAQGRYRYILIECHPELLAERGLAESECLAGLFDAGYRAWLVTHTPAVHRRASRKSLPASELMRPYRRGDRLGTWPHVLAAAPGVPDPM
jgi:FkbM family methyltransferase